MRRTTLEWLLLGATLVVVFAVLGALSASQGAIGWNYLTSVLVIMAVYALFALGLNLEFGLTGLLNFGHVAFMAVGAYTAVLVTERLLAAPSFAERIEGWSVIGAFVALLYALVAGALVLVLVLPLAYRLAKRWRARRSLPATLGIAVVVVLIVLIAVFPYSPGGARAAVAGLGVIVGVLAAALGGILLGLPTVRLREDYLAIVTIGAAELLRSFLANEEQWTHGTLGIQQVERPVVDWALASPTWGALADAINVRPVGLAHAVLGVALVLVVYVLLETLSRSPWGRVLKAIREDEEVAASMGKNVFSFKLQSLAIGSGVAGLAGILLVWHVSYVHPDVFPLALTFFGFTMVVLGGAGNHRGAIAGAILLWGVFELARNVTLLAPIGLDDLAGPPQSIAVGLLLILIVLYRPQGLMGHKEELRHGR